MFLPNILDENIFIIEKKGSISEKKKIHKMRKYMCVYEN